MQKKKYFNFILRLFIVLLCFTPIIWFIGKNDFLVNGVDTNFPLNPVAWFLRRFYVWNPVANAGSDFSSSTAGLFFHFIQVVPHLLGLPINVVQILSFIFWFSVIIFSSYFFASVILSKNYLARLVLVVFYSFNVYLFNTWENVKVSNLSLVSAIPLGMATLVLLNEKRIGYSKAIFFASITAIVLSGAGINPAYFMCFFLVIFIYQLACILLANKDRRDLIKNFFLISSIVILVNAFWLIPTLNFLITNVDYQGGIGSIGFTDWVASLSENTSLLNVLRLQGAWDWYPLDQAGMPLYIPYALNYFNRLPFILFSFAIPILAIISFILKNRKQSSQSALFLAFAVMILVGTFLGAGVHPPTGGLFSWLTRHLPFFSFFRSPWYIFTPLLTLAYASLLALLCSNLMSFSKKVTSLFFAILLIGNFFYSYPLITGKIFRPTRQDSFFVKFPQYAFESAKWLESAPSGRIISYPDDEIENYKWGYRGIESILSLLSNRETLFAPLNAVNAPVSQLVKAFYFSLKRNEIDIAKAISHKLNATLIFEKHDQNTIAADLPQETKNWPTQNFDKWNFIKIPHQNPSNKISTATNILFGYPFAKANEIIRAMGEQEHLINPLDTQVNKIPKIGEIAGKVITAENLQVESFKDFAYFESKLSNRLAQQRFDIVEFVFEIPHEGEYEPVLEKYNLEQFGINPEAPLLVQLNQNTQTWFPTNTQGSFIYYQKQFFNKGEHKLSLKLNNKNLAAGGNFEGEQSYEQTGYGDGEVLYEIKNSENNNYLSIHNLNRAASSATFKITPFDPLSPYLIRLRYQQIYGNNPVAYASQERVTLYKVQTERLPNYPEWRSFNFYYEPVRVNSDLTVSLSAPFVSDPLGTKVLYDDLEVYQVFTNQLLFIQKKEPSLASPRVDFKMQSPTRYIAEVSGDSELLEDHILVFSESYSPFWDIKLFGKDGKQIKGDNLHFNINLYANAWYITGIPSNYTAIISYKTQGLLELSRLLSLIVIAGSAIAFVISKRKQKKNV